MSKKILVLKNQGNLKLESQNWIELQIYQYQRMSIDGKNTYLLKEYGQEHFFSLGDIIQKVDGVMIFVSDSSPEDIRGIVDILNIQKLPHVLLMAENSNEISRNENEIFAIDNEIESIIIALNKLSALIDSNIQKSEYSSDELITKSKKDILEEYASEKSKKPVIIEQNPNSKHNTIETTKPNPIKEKTTIETTNETTKINEHHPIETNNETTKIKETSLTTESYTNNIIEEKLKRIKFNLHPIMMNPVKEGLERLGFSNITVTDIKYAEAGQKSETYRGSQYNMNFSPRLEVMMVVRESELNYILDILSQLKNDDINDNVIIYNTEDAIRISSQEHGNLAVD